MVAGLLLLNVAAARGSDVKVLQLAVSNPTSQSRAAENVVVSVAELKRVAPDFTAASAIVKTEDARELPSQADDLDGDGEADEIAFQVELRPRQTRVLTIAYGDGVTRGDYPKRTHARFAEKFEGMGWESETTAWRLYFDPRNAIDLFGKRRPGLYLETFGSPGYDYHAESPAGRDIYKIGDALGIGSVGALVDGQVVKVSDVASRSWRVLADGPVRSVVSLSYKGWKVGGRAVDLVSRITVWAGERGFEHRVAAENAAGLRLVTGLPLKASVRTTYLEPGAGNTFAWYASWGHQVLMPGATATESLPDQNLGLAVIALGVASRQAGGDWWNVLLRPELVDGTARWYVLAAWDQENGGHALTTRESFMELVKETGERLSRPAQVRVLSQARKGGGVR